MPDPGLQYFVKQKKRGLEELKKDLLNVQDDVQSGAIQAGKDTNSDSVKEDSITKDDEDVLAAEHIEVDDQAVRDLYDIQPTQVDEELAEY